jgi:enoyl-[acyl-carrier protein] reductase/trans-2-enoyl-CoA reductase (NAD+)
LGKIDLVIYSLAAPRRTNPETGETMQSVLKPIGEDYKSKTIDLSDGKVTEVTLEPAEEDEIVSTVSVMGGEDWQAWIDLLGEERLLAEGARTLAYSYVGPEVTWPIYRDGTIGMAKKDLVQTGHQLNDMLAAKYGGGAWVSVNKAVVTQASSAIPVVPLYLSLLFKVMKEKNLHEGCIEQMRRLALDHLADGKSPVVDDQRLIRLDNLELSDDVQDEVADLWDKVDTDNLNEISDFAGFRKEFSALFGFQVDGIDYDEPLETEVRL